MKPTLEERATVESEATGESFYNVWLRLNNGNKLSRKAAKQPRSKDGRFLPSLPVDYESEAST